MNIKINNPQERLNRLWGTIDYQHNEKIAMKIKGKRILDIGCGYGSLVNYLSSKGFDVTGIDFDRKIVNIARQSFPKLKILSGNAENLKGIKSNYYEMIILKDSFHHILIEADAKKIFKNFRRVLKKNGSIIIFDPNPVLLLIIGRKLLSNNCPKISLHQAKDFLIKESLSIEKIDFFETIGILSSGGYIGIDFVPNINLLKVTVAYLNNLLSAVFNSVGLGRYFCWRYIIVASFKNKFDL